MDKLILGEGEVECERCKGTGSTKVKRDPTMSGPYRPIMMCLKCFGTGKLDWIEVVVGVRGFSSSTSSSTPW